MNSQYNKINEQLEASEQLENAFEIFNQFSEKLAASYSVLESQVSRLNKELEQAHSERLIQLAEKEVLATRLEGLLDALPAGIVVLDDDDCITQTNPVARLMLGNNPGGNNLLGQNWQNVARQSIQAEADELRLQDGRWINLSVCPLNTNSMGVDDTNANKGKIILISDITEHRNMQIKINRQQRLTSLGEMVASLAHQIRTPLSSALLYVSTINHPINSEEDRIRFADKIKERLHHLERMVNDMLIFARGDVTESEYINASDIMIQLKNAVEPHREHNSKRDQIQFHIASNLHKVKVKANKDVLQSALQNIIDNAIEACSHNNKSYKDKQEQAVIEIKAFLNTDNQFEINFSDNGCGMSEIIKDKVLEPFFTTRASGTGLGLSIVNETVNRYGGEMNIFSKQGVGSKFILKFPSAEATGMLSSNLSRTSLSNTGNNAEAKIINIFSGATTGSSIINEQEVTL